MTTYRGPSAHATLDAYLEAMPINPAKEINPTSAPADAPTGRRLTEAEWVRCILRR